VSRFGPDPLAFFRAVYGGATPWDIGHPQPAMATLLAEYPPTGPVLDVGCGSGDLAIHIAESGVEALGIDFVEDAIARAKTKKASLPADVASRVDFRVSDALHPSRLRRMFGAVVDSGFYHLFELNQCEEFVAELATVLCPGGRCYLHEFAVTFDIPNVPREVTETELRTQFSRERGWQALTIRTGEFLSTIAPVPAILACVEYVGNNGA
jgi:cyclopropane fatty-acyl-phospholipid synthase-like methyltransferase